MPGIPSIKLAFIISVARSLHWSIILLRIMTATSFNWICSEVIFMIDSIASVGQVASQEETKKQFVAFVNSSDLRYLCSSYNNSVGNDGSKYLCKYPLNSE